MLGMTLSLTHLTRFPARAADSHPAIICLHGRGSNESDLISLAPYLDDRLLWISPRAPLDLMGGYEWYRLEGIGVPNQPSWIRKVEGQGQLSGFGDPTADATAAMAAAVAHQRSSLWLQLITTAAIATLAGLAIYDRAKKKRR